MRLKIPINLLSAFALSNFLMVAEQVWALPANLLSAPSCRTSLGGSEAPRRGDLIILNELSTGVVYQAEFDHRSFAARLPSVGADISFEMFANSIINTSPAVRAPKIRELSEAEAQHFLEQLKKQCPDCYQRHEAKKLPEDQRRISISDFVPGETGADYLLRLGFSRRSMEMMSFAGRYHNVSQTNRQFIRNYLNSEWSRMSASVRQNILDLWGPTLQAEDGSTFISALLERGSKMPTEEREHMLDLLLNQIPQAVRTQVADTWALMTTIGIRDAHDGNWMYYQGHVMAIDLNDTAEHDFPAISRSDLEPRGYMTPFGGAPISYLIENLSPQTIDFLSRLSELELQKLADENHFPLDSKKRDAILNRARLIVRFKREKNYPPLWAE